MKMSLIDYANTEQPLSDAQHYVWQYFAITNHTDTMIGAAKNAICVFCNKSFSFSCMSRAAAHILGCPVLGQIKAGIHPRIVINKKDDDWCGTLKKAQKTIGRIMSEKEQSMGGKKRKQQVMDELLKSPTKQSVESPVIVST